MNFVCSKGLVSNIVLKIIYHSINIKVSLDISVQSFGGKEGLVPRPAEYSFRVFYYLII